MLQRKTHYKWHFPSPVPSPRAAEAILVHKARGETSEMVRQRDFHFLFPMSFGSCDHQIRVACQAALVQALQVDRFVVGPPVLPAPPHDPLPFDRQHTQRRPMPFTFLNQPLVAPLGPRAEAHRVSCKLQKALMHEYRPGPSPMDPLLLAT